MEIQIKPASSSVNTEKNVNKTDTKLCLNMIVKNESKVIGRLLESVAPYIDSYCICDTGSTDNTIALITQFFQDRGIEGKIVQEPFRDFGYNRSYALKQCESMENADYVLLLDADMVFWVQPTLNVQAWKNSLTLDAYYMYQGSENFYYKNVRIVKNNNNTYYWGVTHEFVKTPEGSRYATVPKTSIFINDIGDGGAKSDKFERDIRLLKKGLEEIPNNDRYTFYLANSYRDHGDYELAIETYRKRIEIGGWHEEVWYSYYSIGQCYKRLGKMMEAIDAWMEAYQFFPQRIENLYEIANHYRYIGKNQLAYMFCNIARKQVELHPSPDYLFMYKDVYDYKLDYEMSIIGYYCNLDKHDLGKISMGVLAKHNVETSILKNVLSNYKFYSRQLCDFALPIDSDSLKYLVDVGRNLMSGETTFLQSTPSIVFDTKTQILTVCQRYVDYWINDVGGYENREHITTKNVIAQFSLEDGQTMKLSPHGKELFMEYDKTLDNRYVGLEDVRLHLGNNGEILFNANRGINNSSMMIEHGTLSPDTGKTSSGFMLIDNQRMIEKNWVLFNDATGKLKAIYEWSKLCIGDVVEEMPDSDDEIDTSVESPRSFLFVKTHDIPTPGFFKHVRGSTNGVKIGDEIWFLCHLVSYEDRRYYYHLFIVLDAKTLQLKKYSPLFTFEKEKVEYSLGFICIDDKLVIGYSKMDKKTKYLMLSKSVLEHWMLLSSNK